MAIVIPNDAEIRVLEGGFNFYASHLGLFVNNYTPVPGTIYSSLTECSEMGYNRQSIGWSSPSTDGSGRAWTQFNASAGYDFSISEDMMGTRSLTVYGWFSINVSSGSGYIMLAERFGSPVSVGPSAITINVPRKKVRLYQP